MSETQEINSEPLACEENTEVKVPSARIRVVSTDRAKEISPLGNITIRHSMDGSPDLTHGSYEPTKKKKKIRNSSKINAVPRPLTPAEELDIYDFSPVESPEDNAINNGLDPISLELISSNSLNSSKADSVYSDDIKSDEVHISPKMNREMKNLQTSATNSKILTDFLLDVNESPRSRSRKNKEVPLTDPNEEEEPEERGIEEAIVEHLKEEVLSMKNSPASVNHEGNESDSTTIMLPDSSMEPPGKRRKSIFRSRSRSRSTFRSRKKSIAQQLKDEMLTSDKEELPDDDEEDRVSETSFITNRSIDGRAVNPPPRAGWDSFCFKCHTDSAVLSLACSLCKCSYHRHCVRPNPIPKNVDEFVCPECREIQNAESSNVNKYGHEKIDLNTLADMLMIILEKIRTYPDREHFENEIVVKMNKEPSQPLVVTQMSLKILEGRIKSHHYKVSEAFVHDIKQLEHNWNIVDRTKTKTLKTIIKYVSSETNELEACVSCYERSFILADWFVHPCKRPHLLIWAKLKGYPYWPAKVMSIDARQHIDVRFFGAHDRAWVPATHCTLFSEKDPNKAKGSTPSSNKNASKTQKGIADAMKEKDGYIDKLRDRYGFKYSPFRQTVNPNDLQGHLEFMLPGLKTYKEVNGAEKDSDGNQKEKLTLKIIKGQSSNYQVEQKCSEPRTPQNHKQSEKDRPKLYKVLSKNEDSTDMEQPGKLHPLIIKRKSNVEQDSEKSKKQKVNDTASETSESNASVQSGKFSRRKSTREFIQKHKKATRNNEKELSTEPQAPKKSKHADKQKQAKEEVEEEELMDEITKPKTIRRPRMKSILPESDKPLLVTAITLNVPPGTDEIQKLRDSSLSPSAVEKPKNRSVHRSRSTDKEAAAPSKISNRTRSVSVSSNVKKVSPEQIMESNVNQEKVPQDPEPVTPKEMSPTIEKQPESVTFNPLLVIKDEPVSDCEEIVERSELTEKDLKSLIQDKRMKRRTIVISTRDLGELSKAHLEKPGRARKTFPNPPSGLRMVASSQPRNDNAMVWIPQPHPTTSGAPLSAGTSSSMQSPSSSNRSTPAPEPQISISQVRPIQSSNREASTAVTGSPGSSRSHLLNGVPGLTHLQNPSGVQRRNSLNPQSNPAFTNGQRITVANSPQSNFGHQRNLFATDLPRLAPKPLGVFSNDGNTIHRDNGPISRMFTDNAHRMSDFFRNVIFDTVAAFSPEAPSAENLMLRAEIEKLQREMQTTKSDCQQKMQQLRREHTDEMDQLKEKYDDRIKNLQIALENEKGRAISEVRHQCEIEKQRAIEITRNEIKKTTWCSNCTKEARFYCCWNTSYCGPPCQKNHWQHHQKYCTNKNSITEPQVPGLQKPIEIISPPPTTVINRALVLRAPQQLQQPTQMAPPVTIHQHIILPSGTTTPSVTNVNSPIAPITSHQIYLSAFSNNTRTYYQGMQNNLIVQTVQRSENPNVNIVSAMPLNEALVHQASTGQITMTSSQ